MVNTFKYLVFRNSFRKVLIVFLFMFSLTSFSQSSESNSLVESNTETTTATNVNKEEVSKSRNYNFVLWFMGAKQDPNNSMTTDFNSDKINTKAQILTSGLAPNRLLIKAFLKKAVNFEIAFT